MSTTSVIVWVLTALAVVVVVGTRMRLGSGEAAGRFAVGRGLLNTHLTFGVVALVLWVPHRLAAGGTVAADTAVGSPGFGIFAVGAWWVTAVCGLVILARWLPSRGRHATRADKDTWGEGPGLSVLAHVGMTVGVVVFTYAYLTTG